jgi:ribosome-associated protein
MTDTETPSASLPAPLDSVVEAIEEHKGRETVVLDVRGISGFTDYIVVSSGGSDRHVKAVVDAVEDRLREEDVRPSHIEGASEAQWILMDFIDFVVNVFTPETREFYDLERLWRDAPAIYRAEIDDAAMPVSDSTDAD